MGPMNQLKRMFDPTRLITTIVFLVSSMSFSLNKMHFFFHYYYYQASLVMTLVSAIVVSLTFYQKQNEC